MGCVCVCVYVYKIIQFQWWINLKRLLKTYLFIHKYKYQCVYLRPDSVSRIPIRNVPKY